MSKDRYSDDHTIEVVGGTNTLNIKDNLVVENNLSVSNDLDVVNDLSVTNDLNVANDISCKNLDVTIQISTENISSEYYNFSAEKNFLKPIPVTLLKDYADITKSTTAPSLACSFTNTLITEYPSFNFGSTSAGTWRFDFPIDNFMLNATRVTGIYFLVSVTTAGVDTTFEFDITANSFNSTGSNPPTISVEDSDSVTVNISFGKQWVKAELDFLANVKPDLLGKCYYIRFAKSNSKESIVSIYRCVIECATDDISEALSNY